MYSGSIYLREFMIIREVLIYLPEEHISASWGWSSVFCRSDVTVHTVVRAFLIVVSGSIFLP